MQSLGKLNTLESYSVDHGRGFTVHIDGAFTFSAKPAKLDLRNLTGLDLRMPATRGEENRVRLPPVTGWRRHTLKSHAGKEHSS